MRRRWCGPIWVAAVCLAAVPCSYAQMGGKPEEKKTEKKMPATAEPKTKPVRLDLTLDVHRLLRVAAAKADKSMAAYARDVLVRHHGHQVGALGGQHPVLQRQPVVLVEIREVPVRDRLQVPRLRAVDAHEPRRVLPE